MSGFFLAAMLSPEDLINHLVELLHQYKYEDARSMVAHELDSAESHLNSLADIKLIALIAEIKLSPERLPNDFLSDALKWEFRYPELVCCEIAFLHLLSGDARQALSPLLQWSEPKRSGTYYSRLGTCLLLIGDFSGALDAYSNAALLEPENPDHFNNLGGAYARLQRLDEALQAYENCLRLNPSHPQAVKSRLAVAALSEKGDEYLNEYFRKLQEYPEDIETRLSLFYALIRFKRDNEGARLLIDKLINFKEISQVTTSDIHESSIHVAQLNYRLALASYYRERGNSTNALALVNQCISFISNPDRALLILRASLMGDLGYYKEGLELLSEIDNGEEADDMIFAKAELLNKRGEEKEALSTVRKIKKKSRFYNQRIQVESALLLSLGRIDECQACLLELAENNVIAFAQLIQTRNYIPSDEIIEKLRLIAENPLLPEKTLEVVRFALSEGYARRKDHRSSFYYLQMANQIVCKEVHYKPIQFTKRVNAYIRSFSRDVVFGIERLPVSKPRPIFIVGMPRSGTTLTETIIGSHSDVYPCGELGTLPSLIYNIRNNYPDLALYPKCVKDISRSQLIAMANAYIANLNVEGRKKDFITDKLPHNFMNVGLIHMLFPDSPIIHVMRDPRDTGLSNYQQNFGAKHTGMGYAFDLTHIAKQINDYHSMMEHWRTVGIPMFEFWYEDLVAEQHTITRDLLDYCNLSWDDNALSFHELERTVRTASVGQVRQKMYRSSSQKWRQYKDELEPMISAFDKAVVQFYPGPQE